MRCPTCGNEVNPGEAFCGQCGTPGPSSMPSREGLNAQPGARPGDYRASGIFPAAQSSALNPRTRMPTDTAGANRPSFHGTPFTPDQSVAGTPLHNQRNEFYQDATEAMTLPSGDPRPGYPTPPQQFPGPPVQGNAPGGTRYGTQAAPFQSGNYRSVANPVSGAPFAQPPYANEQPAYDYRTPAYATPLPPHRRQQQSNTLILIVSIGLVGVLISVIGLATLYISRRSSPGVTTPTATAAAVPTPTVVPSPTAMPTAAPTAAPTPAPDAGFLWCGPVCTNYGFTTEYPATWQPGATPGISGIQFANPAQTDQFAAFKAGGATNSSAGALVSNDLQANFADKPGYVAPTSTSTATISGETWATAVAAYQGASQQPEHVEVYATVHQGKAYIIELEAPEAQFASLNSQVFTAMLGKFQFLSQD